MGPSASLSDEHIIPYALGGTLVLPDASCEDCRKITGAIIEQQVLRRMLGDLRAWRKMPSRKRKPAKRYKPRPMLLEVDGRRIEHDAPTPESRLDVVALPALQGPSILEGINPLSIKEWPISAIWSNVAIGKSARDSALKEHPKAKQMLARADFNPALLTKMLAKIGHAFAVAEVGLDGFQPLLPNAIRGIAPWYPGYLVGGDPNPVPKSEYTNEVGLHKSSSSTGQDYLLARIRLFGDLGAPVYQAVVGKL